MPDTSHCCCPDETPLYCVTVSGCRVNVVVPGSSVTLSRGGYSETVTTGADGKACFTPTAGTGTYTYSITPPTGLGYTSPETGTLPYSGGPSAAVALTADAGHVCLGCCDHPVPRVLTLGTNRGSLVLTYGSIPTVPPIPLGWDPPYDGMGWYGEITGFDPDAISPDATKVGCWVPGLPYGFQDCVSRPHIDDVDGDTVTVKYWVWCSASGRFLAAKQTLVTPTWSPLYGMPCATRAVLSSAGTFSAEEVVQDDGDGSCSPFNQSFVFTRSAVIHPGGCGWNIRDYWASLVGWQETMTFSE